MLGRSLKNLGKLNQEQKQEIWAQSVSGSQAWLLNNEPYNLIRDKLGIAREHKSKYDFLNYGKAAQASNNAKLEGIFYESTVMDEVRQHYPDAVYEDNTFRLWLFLGEQRVDSAYITSTPDFYIKGDDNTYTLVGDIKCSVDADSETKMMERYYYQALHNCYVLNCKKFVLCTKGFITRPLNIYEINFTDEDFENYEKLLLQFFLNIQFKNYRAYDAIASANEPTEIGELNVVAVSNLDADMIEKLEGLKAERDALDAQIKDIEQMFKDKCDQDTCFLYNNKRMIVKLTKRIGTVDYQKLIKDYNLKDIVETYRKEPTISKTIKFE